MSLRTLGRSGKPTLRVGLGSKLHSELNLLRMGWGMPGYLFGSTRLATVETDGSQNSVNVNFLPIQRLHHIHTAIDAQKQINIIL